jgi:hypothetical protein
LPPDGYACTYTSTRVDSYDAYASQRPSGEMAGWYTSWSGDAAINSGFEPLVSGSRKIWNTPRAVEVLADSSSVPPSRVRSSA